MVPLELCSVQSKILSNNLMSSILSNTESESEVAQSSPTLCNPMDCSLPGSSVHGIFQARVLEWVAISFSRGSSQPRDRTQVSHIRGRRFNLWATREAPYKPYGILYSSLSQEILNHQVLVVFLFCFFFWKQIDERKQKIAEKGISWSSYSPLPKREGE